MSDTINQILTTQSIEGPLSAGDAIMQMAALGNAEEASDASDNPFNIGEGELPKAEEKTAKAKPEATEAEAEEAEEAEEEVADEEEKPTGKIEVDWGEAPTLAATFEDREIDIPEAALIPVKINGEALVVPLSELRANYSGKVVWQKHFHDLKAQQKLFEADLQNHAKDRTETLTLSKNDPYKALELLHLKSGEDPSEFLDKFIEQSEQIVKSLSAMSPEQRKAVLAHKKLELKRLQLDKEKEALTVKEKAIQNQKELNEYIGQRQREFSISDAEFSKGLDVVAGTEGIDISSRTEKQLADMVVEYIIKFHRPYAEIEEAVAKVAPKQLKNSKFLNALYGVKNEQGLTNDQLRKTIKLYLRDPASKNGALVVKDAQPGTPKSTVKASSNGKPKAKSNAETEASVTIDPLSMDDILDSFM